MVSAQRHLFAEPQADLFGEDTPSGPEPYQVKHEHVLNRLVEMLTELKRARSWPWDEVRIELYRRTVWPHLLRLLPDDQAERWRADLDTEAVRLDEA